MGHRIKSIHRRALKLVYEDSHDLTYQELIAWVFCRSFLFKKFEEETSDCPKELHVFLLLPSFLLPEGLRSF